MKKSFGVISLSHAIADIEIREKFSLSQQEFGDCYAQLSDVLGISEALILGTCNRVEIYYFDAQNKAEALVQFLCAFKGLSFDIHHSFFESKYGHDALTHLHEVAIGLQSMVLGDLEIFGQVKRAYQISCDVQSASTYMHRLLHRVFYCHKIINQSTRFKEGASSVSYTAVKLISDRNLMNPEGRVLVVGAGDMGKDVVKHLRNLGYLNVTICNRTNEKAHHLAQELGVHFIPYEQHKDYLNTCSLLMVAVNAKEALYTLTDFQYTAIRAVIDISSPRAVADEIQTLGIDLYNIDDMGQRIQRVMENRSAEIGRVRDIVSESVGEYLQWTKELEFNDHLVQFKSALEDIQKQVILANTKEWTVSQQQLASEATSQLINKIMKLPAIGLRNACQRGEATELSESLCELFDLERKSNIKSQ
ncbi:glutamyl-tRNA reductase [Reichenbachiella ulvae]|uniref:Glutamyl-tRNA reductase n=1 Tax=Reichenbachiella ulvae TaxID=2980104 RepID=A0ABT3CRI2_9BACT|nr:glutamyl-tRNA reductase [Reichenbachiella ulvae]MCV9386316.1 glutamyl-tRNA reductase [Reichenbachiella ulvae]